MKITKYVHSCLLAETHDRVALIDPGIFSWNSGSFDLDKIDRIDRILITHQHPDHCYPDFVGAVVKKFPNAVIVTNDAVQKILKDAGIKAEMKNATMCSCHFEANHETTEPLGPAPPNSGFHFKDRLTHPGDSNTFNETKEILAMPFVAPWGTIFDAINKVLELQPKYVIPIHDWFYSEEAQKWLYDLITPKLKEQGIDVIVLGPGESIVL